MTEAEFLATKLEHTQAEMGAAILNRGKWERLRDDRRLLTFLCDRARAVDFRGLRVELERIVEGQERVPELTAPRKKAGDCLREWAKELSDLG